MSDFFRTSITPNNPNIIELKKEERQTQVNNDANTTMSTLNDGIKQLPKRMQRKFDTFNNLHDESPLQVFVSSNSQEAPATQILKAIVKNAILANEELTLEDITTAIANGEKGVLTLWSKLQKQKHIKRLEAKHPETKAETKKSITRLKPETLSSKVKDTRNAVRTLATKINELNIEINEKEVKIQEAKEEKEKITEELEKTKGEIKELEEKIDDYYKNKQSKEDEKLETLNKSKNEKELTALLTKKKELEEKQKMLETEKENKEQEILDINKEKEAVQSELTAVREELAEIKEEAEMLFPQKA